LGRNTKYFKEWSEATWKWRLEIIPADYPSEYREDLWSSEEIPAEAVNVIDDLEKKFPGDLPIGIIAAEDLKIEFDLRWLPWDLIEYITQPIMSKAGVITVPVIEINGIPLNGEEEYKKYFDLTNVFILKTDKGSGGDLLPIFIGCQKRSIKSKTTITMDGIKKEITVVSLIKVILENIEPMDISRFIRFFLADVNYYGYYKRYMAFDLVWTYDGDIHAKVDCGTFQNTQDLPFLAEAWFLNIQNLDYAIRYLCGVIGSQFMRYDVGVEIINSAFFHWAFHGQYIHNNTHYYGADLTYEDLYFIGYVCDVQSGHLWDLNKQIGGFLVKEKDAPTLFDYDNMWDYLRAITESSYCKLRFPIKERGFFDIEFNNIFEPESEINVDLNSAVEEKNIEFEDGERVIRKAQGNIKGMGSNDNSEMVYKETGSMAEMDFEFKAVFHNLPTQMEQYHYHLFSFGGNYAFVYMDMGGFFNNKLYYMDSIAGFDGLQPIKLHEFVEFNDGLCWWSIPDTPEIELGSYKTEALAIDFLNPLIFTLQQENYENMVSVVSYAASVTFSKYNQALYKPKYLFEMGITIDNVGDFLAINWGIEFLPYARDIPPEILQYHLYRAVLMSIKMGIKTEIIETEAFVRALAEGV